MPRPLRLDTPGAYFHITARGVERRTIFIDASDRLYFLKILSTACKRYGGRCHAYCLMGNHYHLLLESVRGRLATLMQYLNGTYGRGFNRRRDRIGHLFQGRFGAKRIDRDAYFLEVVRYIEFNPCRAGLVVDPQDWEWSSFRPRTALDPVPECLQVDEVLDLFGSRPESIRGYGRFVREGLSDDAIGRRLRGESIVGSQEFAESEARRARALEADQAVPLHQKTAGRPTLRKILGPVEGAELRRRAVRAFVEHGYSMTEIARAIEVHYTTISRWIRRHECDNA